MSGALGNAEGEREKWNQTARGWEKWDRFLMQWLKPVGDTMLEAAKLEDGDSVLDVATGSGEPGLSAAGRVGNGKVLGLDISQEMVNVAQAKARARGIGNYEGRVYSSSKFPFESNSFDVVLCRFGAMFFPDVPGGLQEMLRVLKPEGRLCLAVWAPPSAVAASATQILTEELRLPEMGPDAPNPFRCSETGKIASLVREAGLRNVEEIELTTQRSWDSIDQYWEYLLDVNTAIVRGMNEASEETRKRAKVRVSDVLHPIRGARGEVTMQSVAWIVHGVK